MRRVKAKALSILLSFALLLQNSSFAASAVWFAGARELGAGEVYLTGLFIDQPGSFKLVFSDKFLSQDKAKELFKEFLFCLSVPEERLWVNLSKDIDLSKILPFELRVTDVGKVFMEADAQLKRDFLSIYMKAFSERGILDASAEIPFPRRLMIVPGRIELVGNDEGVMIRRAEFDVKCDMEAKRGENARLIEQMVIPQLKGLVNHADSYKELRRVYHSIILAHWYKEKAQANKEMVFSDLIDSDYILPFLSKRAWSKWDIYRGYLHSYLVGSQLELDEVKLIAGGIGKFGEQLNSGLAFLHMPTMRLLKMLKEGGKALWRVVIKAKKRKEKLGESWVEKGEKRGNQSESINIGSDQELRIYSLYNFYAYLNNALKEVPREELEEKLVRWVQIASAGILSSREFNSAFREEGFSHITHLISTYDWKELRLSFALLYKGRNWNDLEEYEQVWLEKKLNSEDDKEKAAAAAVHLMLNKSPFKKEAFEIMVKLWESHGWKDLEILFLLSCEDKKWSEFEEYEKDWVEKNRQRKEFETIQAKSMKIVAIQIYLMTKTKEKWQFEGKKEVFEELIEAMKGTSSNLALGLVLLFKGREWEGLEEYEQVWLKKAPKKVGEYYSAERISAAGAGLVIEGIPGDLREKDFEVLAYEARFFSNVSLGLILMIIYKNKSWRDLEFYEEKWLVDGLEIKEGSSGRRIPGVVAVIMVVRGVPEKIYRQAREFVKESVDNHWEGKEIATYVAWALAESGWKLSGIAEVGNIGKDKIEEISFSNSRAKLKLSDGREQEVGIKEVSLKEVIEQIDSIPFLPEVKGLIDLFKKNPPSHIVTFDRIIGKDIQGYGSASWGIGVYEKIADNPMAWLHEILEYLGSKKEVFVEVDDRYATLKSSKENRDLIKLPIRNEWGSYLVDQKWVEEAQKGNLHYGFRIIQRLMEISLRTPINGIINVDELLSAQIRTANLVREIEQKFGHDLGLLASTILGEKGAGTVSEDIDKLTLVKVLDYINRNLSSRDTVVISYMHKGADIIDLGGLIKLLCEPNTKVRSMTTDYVSLRDYVGKKLEEGVIVLPHFLKIGLSIEVEERKLANVMIKRLLDSDEWDLSSAPWDLNSYAYAYARVAATAGCTENIELPCALEAWGEVLYPLKRKAGGIYLPEFQLKAIKL